MTKAQAAVILAAREVLSQIEEAERDQAFTTGNDRAHYNARVECAADRAKDALTDLLIVAQVYGDPATQEVAEAALNREPEPEPEPEPEAEAGPGGCDET